MINNKEWFFPSLRLLPHLLAAGWFPNRWSLKQIEMAKAALSERWLASAEVFTGKFGGLIIGPNFVNTNVNQYVSAETGDEFLLKSILGVSVCPLGFASFLGEGGTIYVTSCQQYFAANSEQIVYLGKSLRKVLEVLVLYHKRPLTPQRWERAVTEFNRKKSMGDIIEQPTASTMPVPTEQKN